MPSAARVSEEPRRLRRTRRSAGPQLHERDVRRVEWDGSTEREGDQDHGEQRERHRCELEQRPPSRIGEAQHHGAGQIRASNSAEGQGRTTARDQATLESADNGPARRGARGHRRSHGGPPGHSRERLRRFQGGFRPSSADGEARTEFARRAAERCLSLCESVLLASHRPPARRDLARLVNTRLTVVDDARALFRRARQRAGNAVTPRRSSGRSPARPLRPSLARSSAQHGHEPEHRLGADGASAGHVYAKPSRLRHARNVDGHPEPDARLVLSA